MIRVSPRLTHLLALLVTSCCVGVTACKEEKVEPPAPKVVEEPTEIAPPEDPLKDAKLDATKHGDLAAIDRSDKARLVAANIESAQMPAQVQKKPAKTSTRPTKHTGTLATDLIAREVRRYEGAMKACYERALKRSPGLKGKVQLTVVVGSDGSTKSATTRGLSLRDDTIVKCMEGHAKKMRFPAPKGGSASFNKVYAFKPEL